MAPHFINMDEKVDQLFVSSHDLPAVQSSTVPPVHLAFACSDYVVKPFGRQEILARITAHLRFKETLCQVQTAPVPALVALT
jgi:two-component SAPR family response regulator